MHPDRHHARLRRGEAAVTVDGKRWVIVFDMNAWADLEELVDMKPNAFLKRLHDEQRTGDFRALLFVGLQEHHAAEILSVRDAGRLLDEEAIGEAIGKALEKALPDAKEAAGAGTANPPNGTGKKRK